MEIPTEKNPLFYLVSVPVFLVGIALGALLISYLFFQTKDAICRLNQQLPQVNTGLTERQMEMAGYLERNRNIFGTVTFKDADSFMLQFSVVNPLDTRNSTTTSVKIPFDQQKDEVIKLKISPAETGSTVKEIKAAFSDLKIGQQILLKILDGKKTVYITP